jgi:hypothetical protein
MAVGPVQPPSPEQPKDNRSSDRPPPPGHDDATHEQTSGERFGPLTIARVSKDDGRALILYGHDEGSPPQTDDALAPEPGSGRDRA